MSRDRISISQLQTLDRRELLDLLDRHRSMYHEWLRRLILQGHRVDVLCSAILGYNTEAHHMAILRHKYKWRGQWSMELVWRGAGKTTISTVAWSIFQLLLNPNRRILIASKTGVNASDMLKEAKQQFETNELLIRLFGNYVGKSIWSDTEIEVAGKTTPSKEPSINTVGLEGAVASKHYDIIEADDLVDEENSRTLYQREKMLNFFYKMLVPTLDPPKEEDPWVGSLNITGTRFHHQDLYGHLQEPQSDESGGEMAQGEPKHRDVRTADGLECKVKGSALIIPLLRGDGTVQPQKRFSQAKADSLKKMGIIRFTSQYMLNCDAMKGSIFNIDDCQVIDDKDIPWDSMVSYSGVDLMISEKEEADMFAQVAIGRDKLGNIYALAFMEKQLSYPKQTGAVADFYTTNKCIRGAIEANAYQKAQWYNVRREHPDVNVVPIITLKDKVTEAKKLTPLFENQKVFFRRGLSHLIEHLVLFPNHRYDDLFDAFNLAVKASNFRRKKGRKTEPGLM